MSDISDVLPTEKSINPNIDILRNIHNESLKDPEKFWRKVAEELFWYEKNGPAFKPLDQPPYGQWFPQWKTNLSYNCLDRHIHTSRRNKVAFFWEGEDGTRKVFTFFDLYREVNKFASSLKKLGVKKGDRVTIYMPMIPELPISMLAVTRLGAIHSVIFGGFTAQAIVDRVEDSKSELIITSDGGFRRGKVIDLKAIVDSAVSQTSLVKKVIVVKRANNQVTMVNGRDMWYDDVKKTGDNYVEPERVEGIHPSYILYTSGTTGKPKGATHSTAGYMVWLNYTQSVVFNVDDSDVYWCAADIGWVTGHSYIVYGPLMKGITSMIYEGTPDYPKADRWWDIIEHYGVTILYTSPTAIRMHMKLGESWAQQHDLSSLKLLGTVGEPINPEAWHWYYKYIGHDKTPIVDTWWQTETGGIMITPQPGLISIPLKPGSATFPMPGVDADVYTYEGTPAKPMEKGLIVIKKPWPGEFMTLWNDAERFASVYFTRFPGVYYPGDYAMKDKDGYFWLLGRADEVLKVAGHRIGTIELEDALIANKAIAESAVIGKPDPIKMQVPVAFVVLRPNYKPSQQLREELLNQIKVTIGPIAVPENVYFVDKLPKTRSGKIMRRVIGAVVQEKPIGDVTTLEDGTSVDEAKKAYEELKSQLKKS